MTRRVALQGPARRDARALIRVDRPITKAATLALLYPLILSLVLRWLSVAPIARARTDLLQPHPPHLDYLHLLYLRLLRARLHAKDLSQTIHQRQTHHPPSVLVIPYHLQ